MKKRKNFKGMTLVEIIVSLAILAVLTLVLVQTSNAINMYIKSANKVNQKTVRQAPVAEVGHKDAGELLAEDVKIEVSGVSITFDTVVLHGDAYRVDDSPVEDEIGGNLNMQYIVDLEVADEDEAEEEEEEPSPETPPAVPEGPGGPGGHGGPHGPGGPGGH